MIDVPEIRAALAEATGAPWSFDREEQQDGPDQFCVTGYSLNGRDLLADCTYAADAHLIASAPSWLGWCCDEIEQLRTQNKRLSFLLEHYPAYQETARNLIREALTARGEDS